jgi:hypothetical protein
MSNLEKQILDKLDHALSAARQSTPDSLSPILFEMRNKIDTLAKSLNDIQEKQELHMATHTITDKNTSGGLADLQKTSSELLIQVKKTNGRVTVLEQWRDNTVSFTKGLKAGGRGTYIAIATVIGVAWIVFGDYLKKKVGL